VETVAVDEATTAYKSNGSLPVVGTNTGVFAATGKPVVVVTPGPPMKAAALELTSTPSQSGALPNRILFVSPVHSSPNPRLRASAAARSDALAPV
jgi:hypothetical protein